MTLPQHLYLSALIGRLEAEDPAKRVPVGFHKPHSYRGYYVDLAFEVARNVTVAEMLTAARSALGATFQGWKGGDYTMRDYTSCWLVAERGDCGETLGALLLDLLLGAGQRTGPAPVAEYRGRVPAHELPEGGRLWLHGSSIRDGAVACTCGEWSPDLPSRTARQRWHRQHKAAVTALEQDVADVCAERYGDGPLDRPCVGRRGHDGWHASAPWMDGDRLRTGATWSGAATEAGQ